MKQKIMLRLLLLVMGVFVSTSLFAQQINVKGLVKDTSGEPIIGANVVVKGSATGTITDFDGKFQISVEKGSILVFSFVGYQAQELPATANMNITLKDDSKMLEDVVVIGYGQVKKNDATGAVTAIDANKLTKGLATSASDLLVGKAAGVSVVTDGGAPGSAASIRIRGGSSMSASNDPLIVIDGVPVDNSGIKGMANPLSSIHPNDIASFTILKDASATAIYGSRASNGVIIITTKTGKAGKVNVNYSGNFSVSTKAKTVDVMDAQTFSDYVKSLYAADSPQVKALGNANTNWQDEIFKTSFSTDHNLSVSGALANMPYRASVSFTDENGILKTSSLQRTTASFALNPKFFNNRLDIKINVKGVYNKNRYADGGAINSAIQFDPTQPIYMEGSQYGNGYYMSLDSNNEPIKVALANPLSYINDINDKSNVYRSIGNIQADYQFASIPGLRANLNLGYDVSESDGQKYIADNSSITWCTGAFKNGFGENTDYWQLKRNHLLDFYLNYNKDFNANNHFDIMGGYSWQHFYSNVSTKYPYSAAMAQKYGKEFYKDADPDYPTESYLISFFGRMNYTFMNRYLLTFTVRDDGSSRFSKNDRWGLFPSVALAWKLKEETFLKNVAAVSDMKLRLGWGITGQQDLNNGDYPYLARYTYSKAGANYFFGDNQYSLVRPEAYDEHLKWEKTTTWNAGLDYGLLNNRLTGTLDFYYRETKDLLNTVPVPGGSNYNNELLTNVGSLVNKGVEFTVTARPIVSKDWNWELNYNVSYNKNKITKLTLNDDPSYKGVIHGGIDGGTGNNILIHQVGKPFNSFYVYKQVYDQDGKPIEGYYEDTTGDGKIEKDDLVAYKKSSPDVIMGLSSNLSYKNWDLAFSLRASIGNYAYNNVQSNTEAHGSTIYDPAGFLKNRNNSAVYTNFNDVRYFSSYYIQNASFLRCDNITLGYRFDKIFNDSQSARVYATVQNPFVITKYDGVDPEFNNDGIDNRIYPHARVFMLGLSLNF